jgi:hypothetical protein
MVRLTRSKGVKWLATSPQISSGRSISILGGPIGHNYTFQHRVSICMEKNIQRSQGTGKCTRSIQQL